MNFRFFLNLFDGFFWVFLIFFSGLCVAEVESVTSSTKNPSEIDSTTAQSETLSSSTPKVTTSEPIVCGDGQQDLSSIMRSACDEIEGDYPALKRVVFVDQSYIDDNPSGGSVELSDEDTAFVIYEDVELTSTIFLKGNNTLLTTYKASEDGATPVIYGASHLIRSPLLLKVRPSEGGEVMVKKLTLNFRKPGVTNKALGRFIDIDFRDGGTVTTEGLRLQLVEVSDEAAIKAVGSANSLGKLDMTNTTYEFSSTINKIASDSDGTLLYTDRVFPIIDGLSVTGSPDIEADHSWVFIKNTRELWLENLSLPGLGSYPEISVLFNKAISDVDFTFQNISIGKDEEPSVESLSIKATEDIKSLITGVAKFARNTFGGEEVNVFDVPSLKLIDLNGDDKEVSTLPNDDANYFKLTTKLTNTTSLVKSLPTPSSQPDEKSHSWKASFVSWFSPWSWPSFGVGATTNVVTIPVTLVLSGLWFKRHYKGLPNKPE